MNETLAWTWETIFGKTWQNSFSRLDSEPRGVARSSVFRSSSFELELEQEWMNASNSGLFLWNIIRMMMTILLQFIQPFVFFSFSFLSLSVFGGKTPSHSLQNITCIYFYLHFTCLSLSLYSNCYSTLFHVLMYRLNSEDDLECQTKSNKIMFRFMIPFNSLFGINNNFIELNEWAVVGRKRFLVNVFTSHYRFLACLQNTFNTWREQKKGHTSSLKNLVGMDFNTTREDKPVNLTQKRTGVSDTVSIEE